MRLTYKQTGRARGHGGDLPAPQVSKGTSVPVPVGGWDAYSPISAMPPQNAVELVNWFPQPGWIELRKGFLNWSDLGTLEPVESLMAYQAPVEADNRLFAASDGTVFDVSAQAETVVLGGFDGVDEFEIVTDDDILIDVGSEIGPVIVGLGSDRWQHVNYAGSGGNFLWMCNGVDTPRYYNGITWNTAVITGVTAEDMVSCTIYRGRIWTVLKDSTKAAYLPLDSVQGAATTFDLGGYFQLGGQLTAIGTWSTDVSGGTNEFIVFVSSFGECAIFLLYDPTDSSGFGFRGVSTVGSPIGRRCIERVGSDMALITIDGVLPFAQIVNYDRAALQSASLTKNIRSAMNEAAKDYKNQFGWQIISYPRSTMAILNVPIVENANQQQYVMNTLTGAWCRFTGQNANCWEIFNDRAYFGGNDGLVCIADAASGDQDQTLEFDAQGAFNYYNQRGRNKRWTTVRPLITRDTALSLNVFLGLSIDFQLAEATEMVLGTTTTVLPTWDDPDTVWDEAIWPGEETTANWIGATGVGYNASIRLTGSIPWEAGLVTPLTFKVSSYDVLFDLGAFI